MRARAEGNSLIAGYRRELLARLPADVAEEVAGGLEDTYQPAKVKPGYANFAIADPPLKLVLMENPGQGGSLNHLGVEVADTGAVDAGQTWLAEVGLASIDERDTTCYARQNKFWVEGAPNGERWEIYTVLEDSHTFSGQAADERLAGQPEAAPAGACCA
jgi:hypothetical protein